MPFPILAIVLSFLTNMTWIVADDVSWMTHGWLAGPGCLALVLVSYSSQS